MFAVLRAVSSRAMLICCFALLFFSLLCLSQAHAIQGDGEQQFSVGDRVQFQRMGKTFTGTIVELTGPGWPRVEYQQKDKTKRTVFPPKHLKIAVEVAEEAKPEETPIKQTPIKQTQSVDATLRTWKSSKGTFSILAKLVSQDQSNVKLETESGKIVDVPKEKLSSADQDFLANLNSDDDNPFGPDGVSVDP